MAKDEYLLFRWKRARVHWGLFYTKNHDDCQLTTPRLDYSFLNPIGSSYRYVFKQHFVSLWQLFLSFLCQPNNHLKLPVVHHCHDEDLPAVGFFYVSIPCAQKLKFLRNGRSKKGYDKLAMWSLKHRLIEQVYCRAHRILFFSLIDLVWL